jgi:ACS family hexuronate transporter-like MFS transporter
MDGTPKRTVGGLRWFVVGLIGLATVINYIDRNALAVMWPAVSKDIGADKSDYALLVTVFMIAYALGQSLFGRILDVIGTRLGFVVSIAIWSLSIAGHAAVRSLGMLSLLRVTLGLSEAGNWPGAVKANATWFPAPERGDYIGAPGGAALRGARLARDVPAGRRARLPLAGAVAARLSRRPGFASLAERCRTRAYRRRNCGGSASA